jgi:hypothetical protein
VEDSETSGRISIAAAPDVRELVVEEVEAFRKDYPQADCGLREPESSAQVIAACGADERMSPPRGVNWSRRSACRLDVQASRSRGTASRRTRCA